MLCSTSVLVRPVEAHPGMSGGNAEKPVAVSSTTIKYFFMALDLPVQNIF
jgi:hypothetical protein